MKRIIAGISLFLLFINLHAQDLMADYDVTFYGIYLEGSPEQPYIQGSGTIGAKILSDRFQTFQFELAPSFEIDSVCANNKKCAFVRNDRFVKAEVKAAKGEWVKVETFYHGEIKNKYNFFSGIAIEEDSRYGNSQTLYTLSEPSNAYQWFPVKQVLTDKADSAHIHITTSQNYKGVSNGLLKQTVILPGNRIRYEWETHYPTAYYLLSVTVGDFQELRETAHLPSGKEVPVYLYLYNDEKCMEEGRAHLPELVRAIEYCSELLGDYPFANEKYGICMANMGGGMEHQTITTQSGLEIKLTLHELIHQWFGDYVTCTTWNHIWVNEGFAEGLTAAFYPDFGDKEFWLNYLESYRKTCLPSKGSIYITDTEKDNNIFDYLVTYGKGSFLVRQLQYEVNDDELFFHALRTYLQRYAHSNATAYDFMDVLQEVTGRNFDYFFPPYFLGGGFPLYTFTWQQKENSLYLTSRQTGTDPETPFYQMHYDVAIQTTKGKQIERVFQDEPLKEFIIAVEGTVKEVGMDPECRTFSRLRESTNSLPEVFADTRCTAFFERSTGNLVITHPQNTSLCGEIYSVNGVLIDKFTGTGYSITLPMPGLRPGVYYLKINSGNFSDCLKIIKTK